MRVLFRILMLCWLTGSIAQAENNYRSEITDLGRVIYQEDESRLLGQMQAFETRTQVAVKVYTTFRLHQNWDVRIIFTKETSGDNTVAIVVQTGSWSLLTEDYEATRYKEQLHIDRSANLNREQLLPDYMIEVIRERMIDKFYQAGQQQDSKNLYYSLEEGVTVLSALIYNPVVVKGSLIPESLWNRPDAYLAPELAGFIDGSYNTIKALPELDNAVEQASEVARSFAFNYLLNQDGYRSAVNELVTEVVTNLDTYISLANALAGAQRRVVNIYRGTTLEDRYWRGIIAFEVAGMIVPLSKTKAAARSASAIKELLEEIKSFKLTQGLSKGSIIDDLFSVIKNEPDFQAFRNLCKNSQKISVELADVSWDNTVSQIRKDYMIASDRNIARMEYDGQEFLIASGKKYNGQMVSSNKFVAKEFVEEVEKGNRVFTPSIGTRHLDTESIGLEYFAKQKGAVRGGTYSNVKGDFKITSDLCPCPSCSSIFQQFSRMFPNVKIKITTTNKLHY